MQSSIIGFIKNRIRDKSRRRRYVCLLLCLSMLVASGVIWELRLTGISMTSTDEPTCGLQEHTHTADCYDADGNLICGLQEHVHTAACYSDNTADVETAEVWEATLPQKTGVQADDLVAAAESQLGYRESAKNYAVADDGTIQGYTRYGAWYGNACGAWNAMFVSFCLHYAGIPESQFPYASGCYAWTAKLQDAGLWRDGSYSPKAGDVVFLDENNVGIVTASEGGRLTVIAGDYQNSGAVSEFTADASGVTGYGVLTAETAAADTSAASDVATETAAVTETAAAAAASSSETAAETASTDTASAKTAAESTAAVDPIAAEAPMSSSAAASSASISASEELLGAADSGTTSDLSGYITGASFTDGNDNPITSASDGDSIKVNINYSFNAGVVTSDNKIFTYQLPDGISVKSAQSGGVFDSNGVKVGDYAITTDGLITITFLDAYATGDAIGGTVKVSGSASNSGTSGSKTVTIGGQTLTIGPKTSVSHDLYVQKTGSANEQDGKVYYTVTAYTTAGTESTVSISDTITNATYDQSSFVVYDSSGNVVDSSNYTLYFAGNSASVLYLPKLDAGGQYVVKYSATPSWNSTTDTSLKVNNSVTATSSSDTYTATSETDLTLLLKYGQYNSTTKKISWTIDLNSAHENLNGYTLSDTLNNPDGSAEMTGTVTVNPAIDGSTSITLPYTFTHDDYNSYRITYSITPDTTSFGTKKYSNNVTLTKGGETHTASSGDVGVGGTNLTKSFVSEQDVSGKDGADYTWDSILTVPSTGITSDYFYTDYMDGQSDRLLITADTAAQLVVSGVKDGTKTTLKEGTDYSIDYFYYDKTTRKYTDSYSSTQELITGSGKATTFTIRFLRAIPTSEFTTIEVAYVTYADYSAITVGQSHNFKNEAHYGYGDTYDTARAYHSHKKTASIDKQCYNPSSQKWSDSDFSVNYDALGGVLSYRLLVNTDGGTTGAITITDTLPAGTEFDTSDSSHYAKFYVNNNSEPKSTSINGTTITASDIVHFTPNSDGTLTITVDDKYGTKALSIYYSVIITNPKNGMTAYTNTAVSNGVGVSQTTNVTHDVVTKWGQQGDGTNVSANIVTYYVILNPGADDLDPNSDKLTLTDTLSYTAADVQDIHLIQGSVKLFNYDSTATNSEGSQLDASFVNYTYDTSNHKTTFTIPDSKSVVLEYQYYVTPAANKTPTINNAASLSGSATYDDSSSIQINVTDSSATADKGVLTVCKVDAENNNIKLSGAKFALYKWNSSSWEYVGGDYTTNSSGLIKFDTKDTNAPVTPGLTLYALAETTPPSGYATAPYLYFVFGPDGYTADTLKTAMESTVAAAGAADVNYFLSTGGTAYVQDTRNTIQVQKVWLNKDGTANTSAHSEIQVQLLRGDTVVKTQVLNDSNNWSYTWTGLDTSTVYTVREVSVPDGYTVSYDNNNGITAGTITVKNTYTPVYSLPHTGGIGLAPFIFAGLMLLTIPAAVLTIDRRKKRTGGGSA
jgi:LPXTG-motif cell wall-anchored protein